ncbi:Uncharacterised protein [Streptococcus pneumoniae]|nr:Uncharacterised protein [Streptococcus pneumoniae]
MKNIIPALLVYFIVCVISVIIPASEGYNYILYKQEKILRINDYKDS